LNFKGDFPAVTNAFDRGSVHCRGLQPAATDHAALSRNRAAKLATDQSRPARGHSDAQAGAKGLFETPDDIM
jgi:hypothetical protein